MLEVFKVQDFHCVRGIEGSGFPLCQWSWVFLWGDPLGGSIGGVGGSTGGIHFGSGGSIWGVGDPLGDPFGEWGIHWGVGRSFSEWRSTINSTGGSIFAEDDVMGFSTISPGLLYPDHNVCNKHV